MAQQETSAPEKDTGGFGSLGWIVGALVVAWGAALAATPLNDNSFFTHLATGRLILDEGRVPSSDPYTFTAAGEPWTVQSWLASVAYATAEQVAGDAGLRLVAILLFGTGMGLLWTLTRSAPTVIARIVVIAVALAVVTPLWTPRPFMAGVLGLGAVILALDDRLPPWSLVPILWLWANSHGSYPLALGLALLTMAGRWLDGRPVRQTVQVLGATASGIVLAVVGPLGSRVLTFPVKALTQNDALTEIAEWQPPDFQSVGERAFLVLVVLAILALCRRPSWTVALPATAFAAAGLLAQRNIVMATVVLVPVLASGIMPLGSLRSTDRPGLGTAFSLVAGVTALAAVVTAISSPTNPLTGHPTEAVAWLDASGLHGAQVRLAAQDRVGNLLEVLDGPTGRVFVDDRVDMLPEDVFDDELVLVRGRPEWQQVLDRHAIDLVLWDRQRPLGSLLATSEAWRIVYSDRATIVACRRDGGCVSD